MSDLQFYTFLLIALIFLIFNIPSKFKYNSILKEEVGVLQLELQKEKNDNKALKLEIQRLNKRVKILEESNNTVFLTKEKATLLVMGSERFGLSDRNALRRAGILFHRLVDGSFYSFKDELQRKRSENRQYRVVHISSHASISGVEFSDGIYTGEQLSEIVSGVQLLFLASCNNVKIADSILGIVSFIVVVYEQVDSALMEEFVYEFYNQLKISFEVENSFREAINKVPTISEFVDLRKA